MDLAIQDALKEQLPPFIVSYICAYAKTPRRKAKTARRLKKFLGPAHARFQDPAHPYAYMKVYVSKERRGIYWIYIQDSTDAQIDALPRQEIGRYVIYHELY